MNELKKQVRIEDFSLSEITMEEFQRFADIYFENARCRLEPFYFAKKNINGSLMKEEGTLYYVQSLSARGEMNADKTLEDIQIGITVAGHTYFVSDPAYYMIINDFVCDELTCEIITQSTNKVDDNSVYCVGWKAVRY